MTMVAPPASDIKRARVLALLGDSVTTTTFSCRFDQGRQPGGKYLIGKGVKPDGLQFVRRAPAAITK
jgi:aconitase A